MCEMVIFNCPAYKGFTSDIPDWLDNTNCGHYVGQVPCQDCTDCLLKQIVELCEDEVELVKKWQEETKYPFKPTAFELAEKILNQLDIQEVE